MSGEYLLIRQLFVKNNISHEKRERRLTFPHSHPDSSFICHVLSLNPLQHRTLGFANGTAETASRTSTLFWNLCSPRAGNHWVRSQDFTDDVRGTANQISARCLPSVRLCATTPSSDIPLFGSLKKHRDKFQVVAKVHQAVSQQYRSQSPEFCGEAIHSLTQSCYKLMRVTTGKRR
jgi:hypothetical protein